MANDGIRVELATRTEQLTQLGAAWETLWASTPGARWSQHPAMCSKTIEAAQRRFGRRPSVLTAWRGDSLVGILPLMTWSLFFIAFFAPPTLGVMETASALMAPDEDAEQLTKSMLSQLIAGVLGSVILLPFLRADKPFGAAILKRQDALALGSVPFSEVRRNHCDDWEQHLASRTGKDQLRTYRKRRRQLGELGNLQCRKISENSEKIAALEWLFQNKKAWIVREKKQVTPFFSDENFDFIARQLTASGGESGFSIYAATLDERIIAAQLITTGVDVLELIAVSHDKELNKYSVGRLIVEHVAHDAISENMDIDLGFGAEQWKEDFYTDKVNTYRVSLLQGPTAVLLPFFKAVAPLHAHAPRLRRWTSRQFAKLAVLKPTLTATAPRGSGARTA